jgi:hypothetical protein
VLGLFGAIFARLFSMNIWISLFQAGFFIMLGVYTLATIVALIVAPEKRRFLVPALLLGLIGLTGSTPVGRFVVTKEDQRFMRNLARYQQVVQWVEQHHGAKPAREQFAGLASDIVVHESDFSGLEIFFITYPRLHGYAYTPADKWNDSFLRAHALKKLTNNWYRI